MNGHSTNDFEPTFAEWLLDIQDTADCAQLQWHEAPAGTCLTCGGYGFLEMDRSTGIEPTCPNCIDRDKCPRCLTDMRVEYDREGYPVDATCPACGYVWRY